MVREANKIYKSAMKKYCVIGYPVKYSLSPRLFNTAFKKAKLSAKYEFAEVAPGDFGKFMRSFGANFAGANVTIPYKQDVIKYLDKISEEARKIGAVNVIVNKKGKLIGYNTDVFGAMAALKTGIKSLRGKRAIVLGAGGAARAVVYGLKKAGAYVTILNRTLARAKKLARDFKCEFGGLEDFAPCDILINTTSVGMWPNIKVTPFPDLKKQIASAQKRPVVMDIIYRPHITKFLRDAKSAGCRIITGDKMFYAQAAKTFKIWTHFYRFRNSDPLTSGGGGASSTSVSP